MLEDRRGREEKRKKERMNGSEIGTKTEGIRDDRKREG